MICPSCRRHVSESPGRCCNQAHLAYFAAHRQEQAQRGRKRKAPKAFGVPAARGPLRIYRDGVLVSEVTQTEANKTAARVVAGTQGHGRIGRSM